MKKAPIFLGILLALASAHVISVASAACTPVSSTYPGSLDNFVANDCIPSAWANKLETTIGTTTATSSLEQRVAASSSSSAGVTALTGTANQVNVSNATGSVTLSTPQNIATSSSPTFAGLTVSSSSTFTAPVTVSSSLFAGTSTALFSIVPEANYGSTLGENNEGALNINCTNQNAVCEGIFSNNPSLYAPLLQVYSENTGTNEPLVLLKQNGTSPEPIIRLKGNGYVPLEFWDQAQNNASGVGEFQLNDRNGIMRLESRATSDEGYDVAGLFGQAAAGGQFVWGGSEAENSTSTGGGFSSMPSGQGFFNIIQGDSTTLPMFEISTTSTLPGNLFFMNASGNIAIGTTTTNGLVNINGTTTAPCFSNNGTNCITSTATTTITASGTLTGPSFTFGTSTTITPVTSGTALYWNLINSGNWAGTWQGVNSTTFYLASNPSNFASAASTAANYAPFWTSSASTTLSASSSLYLNNSQVAIGTTTFNGILNVTTNATTTNAMTIDADGNVFFGSATDTSQSAGVSSTVSFVNPANNNQDSYVDFVNRANGKGEYFLVNASSSFENIRIEQGAYASQWDLGMFGSTAFSIFDDVDGTTPFTIAKDAPNNSLTIASSGNTNFGFGINVSGTAAFQATTTIYGVLQDSGGNRYVTSTSATVGDGITVTSTISGATTTFSTIGVSTTCAQGLNFVSTTVVNGVITGGSCDSYLPYWQPMQSDDYSDAGVALPASNTVYLYGPYTIDHAVKADAFQLAINTTSTASSDIGIYSLSSLSATSGTLLMDTGAKVYSASTGPQQVSSTQGTVILPPGMYLVGVTSASTTGKFDEGLAAYSLWGQAAGSTSTAGSGVLPTTTSIPAYNASDKNFPSFSIFL